MPANLSVLCKFSPRETDSEEGAIFGNRLWNILALHAARLPLHCHALWAPNTQYDEDGTP